MLPPPGGCVPSRGSLAEPGRRCVLQGASPGPEVALALVGAALRLNVAAQASQVRGGHRVVIGDNAAVGVLLAQLGAREGMLAWQQLQTRRQARSTSSPVPSFETANQRRVARAATVGGWPGCRQRRRCWPTRPRSTCWRRGGCGGTPAGVAGGTRRPGRPADDQDAVAGRLRRLLCLADRHATGWGCRQHWRHQPGAARSRRPTTTAPTPDRASQLRRGLAHDRHACPLVGRQFVLAYARGLCVSWCVEAKPGAVDKVWSLEARLGSGGLRGRR